MKPSFETSDHVALGSSAIALTATALLYSSLPERIPTHFDLSGNADGFSPRALGAFLLPAIALGVWVLLRVGPRLLPAAWRARLVASPSALVAAIVAVLFSGLHFVVIYAATHPGENVGAALGAALGAGWVALGLVMPRVRRNPWVGVRTPWTLSSDENWARTHRFAGYAFVISGLVAVGSALVRVPMAAPVAILVSAVASAFYSFVVARRAT